MQPSRLELFQKGSATSCEAKYTTVKEYENLIPARLTLAKVTQSDGSRQTWPTAALGRLAELTDYANVRKWRNSEVSRTDLLRAVRPSATSTTLC
jgi:hypothetical protein